MDDYGRTARELGRSYGLVRGPKWESGLLQVRAAPVSLFISVISQDLGSNSACQVLFSFISRQA